MEGQPSPRLVTVRPLQPGDRDQVRTLLAGLPLLYPGAEAWLDRRLGSLEDFWVLTIGERVVGTWVESPKPDGRLKIANMYVEERHRGEGLGRVLVSAAVGRWVKSADHRFYVTVSEASLGSVSGLLAPYGFSQEALVEGRYLAGHDEVVLSVSREDLVPDPPIATQSVLA